MDVAEIMELIGGLPPYKQREVAKKAVWLVDRNTIRENAAQRYADIVSTAERVTGFTNDPVKKDSGSVTVRLLAGWKMMDEGYTKMEISRAMKRDHATVVFIARKRTIAEQIPAAYRDLLTWYKQLNEKLLNND